MMVATNIRKPNLAKCIKETSILYLVDVHFASLTFKAAFFGGVAEGRIYINDKIGDYFYDL